MALLCFSFVTHPLLQQFWHIYYTSLLQQVWHIYNTSLLQQVWHIYYTPLLQQVWHIYTSLLQQVWHLCCSKSDTSTTSLLQQVWHLLGTCKVWSKGLKRHFRHFSNTCVHTQASSNKKHTHAHTHTPSTNSHASLTPSKCRNRPEGDKSVPCHRKGAAG